MRLGKDVLEADLYAELGLLPDATESEIRVAYRQQVRTSHPDLNHDDPEAVLRTKRLNAAAKVLLDPALRRIYDRAPRGPQPVGVKPARRPAWFEQTEQSADDDWAPPRPAPRERRTSFGNFFAELRGRDGRIGLQVQELVESLSARQQIGVAALLFAVALGLIVMASPRGLVGDSLQPTSVNVGSVYP
ncbi:MAG TPA: J domain-containing protein [Polyangiaceae bacterium]|nr:J domain-containing protein [Polyangiaceae bacterium]